MSIRSSCFCLRQAEIVILIVDNIKVRIPTGAEIFLKELNPSSLTTNSHYVALATPNELHLQKQLFYHKNKT